MRALSCLALWSAILRSVALAAPNLVLNGGFESGLVHWRSAWSRDPGTVNVHLDQNTVHSGISAVRLEHRGKEDWSFEPELRLSVSPGDIIELEAWIGLEGPGSATLCVSSWDEHNQVVDWSFGERTVHATTRWTRLRSRFAIPEGVTSIQPRLIGYGKAVVWLDDFSMIRLSRMDVAKRLSLPAQITLSNAELTLSFFPSNATFIVRDQRTSRTWLQKPTDANVIVTGARQESNRILVELHHVPSGLGLRASFELDPARPELAFTLDGSGELPVALRYPYPFVSQKGDHLVIPMNEGISYPVDDTAIETFRLIAYGGHGICMAFWGVTDNQLGHAVIIETPDDAAIQLHRFDGLLAIAPEWDPQKGQFGYRRRLRYVFFDAGGHVAIAKRYREYAQLIGRFKTLAEKRRENPNVDLLVGAVNVWNWDCDPVSLARQMQEAGIEHILWSRGGSPDALRALNEMNVLTSRYDIYQDVMDPAHFPNLGHVHPDWTTAAWPEDIIRRADGTWLHGWSVQGKHGAWYDCGVICDRRALTYARSRISAELATHPYKCRFIDTTTAAPWNECYSTNHPMNRSESREWKMKLLDCVSREFKLVTGCETGHDAAVPYLHYFEGMLSLGPYRVPDAGRAMQRIWNEAPARVVKFQLGHTYRLPLWELVYHDCVVAQWYWGDYNNKLPALWDKRDLFNVLYGTPPMFMFDQKLWQSQKSRFVQSYRDTSPCARATAYSEMIDHRFLTPDRDVQQTRFANGVIVTVNFGHTPFLLPSGELVEPMAFKVVGLP